MKTTQGAHLQRLSSPDSSSPVIKAHFSGGIVSLKDVLESGFMICPEA